MRGLARLANRLPKERCARAPVNNLLCCPFYLYNKTKYPSEWFDKPVSGANRRRARARYVLRGPSLYRARYSRALTRAGFAQQVKKNTYKLWIVVVASLVHFMLLHILDSRPHSNNPVSVSQVKSILTGLLMQNHLSYFWWALRGLMGQLLSYRKHP